MAPPLLPGPPERVQQWLGRPRLSHRRPGWGAWEPEYTVRVHISASWVSFGRRGGAPSAVLAPRGTRSPRSSLRSTEQFVSKNDYPKEAGPCLLAVLLHPGLPHIIVKKFLAGSIARRNTGGPVRFELQMDNNFLVEICPKYCMECTYANKC